MKKKIARPLLLLSLAVLLCLNATSCLGLLVTVGGMIFSFSDQLSDNRIFVYGNENDLAVTFRDDVMLATWDYNAGYDYELSVKTANETAVIDVENGYADLSQAGFSYSDALQLTLTKTKTGSVTDQVTYHCDYEGLSESDYDSYVAPVNAGFSEIDRYIATRNEWFDFFSYYIIFRDDAEEDTEEDGTPYFMSETTCYLAYPFDSYAEYAGLSKEQCLENEVYSAIDAYEDSAAYAYSYSLNDDGKTVDLCFKFYYDTVPDLETNTYQKYVNRRRASDPIHYSYGIKHLRSFPIDEVEKTIEVESSDQLYFALKKGYRPLPLSGSRAEILYNEMRVILARINRDSDSEYDKLHYIYDYIIDTALYDYEFTDNVMKKERDSGYSLFRYKCLYLEGVFGVQNDGTINKDKRVAICDGLSKAYFCMATIEGINCLKISGTVNDEGHAWNKAQIGGSWYLIDTTWGNELSQRSNLEYLSHDYFLVKDDAKHEENPYLSYPAAPNNYKDYSPSKTFSGFLA